jgi:very-short-patch-repair endonuclease
LTAHQHTRCGCRQCANEQFSIDRRSNKNIFIKKSNAVHDNKYDYSLVEYINNETKIIIICNKHGEFKQRPIDHYRGNGCPMCSGNKIKTTDDFIKKAKLIHGNKFDYSLANYVNKRTKIKIICPKHGVFEQTPNNHYGCDACDLCRIENSRTTLDDFISKCKLIHNNKYDYSLVKYINSNTKIKIMCPVHGIFEQQPSNHLNLKNGCPFCKESVGEKIIEKCLKFKQISFTKNKKFYNCKNKRCLPFDFYLPDHNICIEHDGVQHFKSINFFGGDKSLKSQQKRDKIKTEYCLNNNILLIRIAYDQDIHQSIERELTPLLSFSTNIIPSTIGTV